MDPVSKGAGLHLQSQQISDQFLKLNTIVQIPAFPQEAPFEHRETETRCQTRQIRYQTCSEIWGRDICIKRNIKPFDYFSLEVNLRNSLPKIRKLIQIQMRLIYDCTSGNISFLIQFFTDTPLNRFQQDK